MSIECRSIHKAYRRRRILENLNVHFTTGKCHCIIGGNGAGKTTLLKILAGLEKPDSGKVRIFGSEVRNDSDMKSVASITYSGSNPYMLQGSVKENIAYPMTLKRQGCRIDEARVDEIARRLGLEILMNQEARTLSAGEKQKVALARAMVWEPEVLLLDEPTANIDRDMVESVEKLLHEYVVDFKKTLVVVSHDHHQAMRISDSIWRLDSGKLEQATMTTIDKEITHGLFECR